MEEDRSLVWWVYVVSEESSSFSCAQAQQGTLLLSLGELCGRSEKLAQSLSHTAG